MATGAIDLIDLHARKQVVIGRLCRPVDFRRTPIHRSIQSWHCDLRFKRADRNVRSRIGEAEAEANSRTTMIPTTIPTMKLRMTPPRAHATRFGFRSYKPPLRLQPNRRWPLSGPELHSRGLATEV
jgi:hypothetical protein